jgi:hypothetical protein
MIQQHPAQALIILPGSNESLLRPHCCSPVQEKEQILVDNSWFTWETSAKALLVEDYIVLGLNHETFVSSSKMTMSWCRQWGWLLDDYNHPTTGGKIWWI